MINVFHSGFVSIVGRPNVGKSTLINALVKQKIAITSDRAQTTRNTIQGVVTTDDYQIVFVDTPGIHKPKHQLGESMNKQAYSALYDGDVVLFLAPINEAIGAGDLFILERIKMVQVPVVLVITKCDLGGDVQAKIDEWMNHHPFTHAIGISSTMQSNLTELEALIAPYLEVGPKYFPDDQIMNYNERFLVSEIVREKVLYLTEEEIPHSVAVVIDQMQDGEEQMEIIASIVVERKSQKGIVIGKQGQMIKQIRVLAQRDLRRVFQKSVYLELYVKDEKDWRNKKKYLKEYAYQEDNF